MTQLTATLPASRPEADETSAPTPMMAQYLAVKNQYPDTLVFYRMGDFFEMFFDDALSAAPILDIALTRRGKHDDADIPMCGVPVHSYESYLAKLIRHGFKVAICDQTETPEEAKARRGYKALVTRDVIRVVTPGTLTEETLLDARAPNYLASIAATRGQVAAAWLDLSTGDFLTQTVPEGQIASILARIGPREILVPEKLYENSSQRSALALYDRVVTRQPDSLFDPDNTLRHLTTHFSTNTMDSFGSFTTAETTAAGALLDYAERTQKAALNHLRTPVSLCDHQTMQIDPATRRNLELVEPLAGEKNGSLLSTIDHTVTASGGRLLYTRLMAPLCDLDALIRRHDQVEFFTRRTALRTELRIILKTTPDMERALARLSLSRGAPRDLAMVMKGLHAAGDLIHLLNTTSESTESIKDLIADIRQTPDLQALHDTLVSALNETLPATLQDGHFIRPGFDPTLDQQRTLRDDGRRMIVDLQQKYIADTGIETLKIAHNNILGYYIDVSAKRADVLFGRAETYIHRQTLAGNVRFTTTELTALERDLMQASDRALAIELELFKTLVAQTLAWRSDLIRIAGGLAALDVAAAHAHLAEIENHVRPEMTAGTDFQIREGRHPVVEHALKKQNTPFIANDTDLSPGKNLWLITGPNMAGKSTVLRQNALIILMAQMGAFVPAAAARIGLVDRLFSRVGASDDLAQGRSTFMVEMVETAAILNQATPRSFIILDEIGRGTATYDGLSIAWATLEYLHDTLGCRALFATHYHELTDLTRHLKSLHVARLAVKEWQGSIVFLHRLEDGVAQGSYGIHVARLAGLPASVTARAEQILGTLESQTSQQTAAATAVQSLPLFSAIPVLPAPPPLSMIEGRLRTLDPDTLSPRAALDLIYALKKMI